MFWRDEQEPIISSTDTNGNSTLTYVYQEQKLETYRWLNSRIVNALRSKDIILKYKSEEVHMVAEAMNRVPMYCNLLTSLGYKNILFIGHFNAAQYSWLLDRKEVFPETRMYDAFPPERNGFLHYPDPHVLFQFIPIFMKHWGYSPKITFVRPPEPRHKGIIHHLYNLFKVSDQMVTCNVQYKHGMTEEEIAFGGTDPDNPFDAVVFAGVPKMPGKDSFTMSDVKDAFAAYVTPNCEFVDLWAQYDDSEFGGHRFFNDEHKHEVDAEEAISEVFHTRAMWDQESRNSGRPEEYNFMRRMVKIFSNSPDRTVTPPSGPNDIPTDD
jgi:hypothetical protein